jgi:hypothetical protein
MFIHPRAVFAVIWIGWIVSWMAAAFWSNRTEKLAFTWDTLLYRVFIVAGFILITPWTSRRLLAPRLWHVGYAGAHALAALTLAGILFTWWARIHIGRLWSGSITRKEGHHIVDTGPYALVRHPYLYGIDPRAVGDGGRGGHRKRTRGRRVDQCRVLAEGARRGAVLDDGTRRRRLWRLPPARAHAGAVAQGSEGR